MRQLNQRGLGIAIQQNIGLGIDQHRAPDLVGPVVVVRDPAQRRFDTADYQRHIGVGFTAALRVDQHRTVGPFTCRCIRSIGIVGAYLAVGSVSVNHGIHIPRRDAEIEIGPAQHLERVSRHPFRLTDDADPETLRFEQAPYQGHAETRMVDISVAGDQNNVAAIPAERIHFGPRHRQNRSRAEAFGPIGTIAIDGF